MPESDPPQWRMPDGTLVPERRSFPRPPLRLNLVILFLGIAGVVFAHQHRERVEQRFADVIAQRARTPADLEKLKQDLATLDLTRDQLEHEIEGRMKFVEGLQSDDFYLSIDSRARKMRFYYGGALLREADVTVGEARTVRRGTRSWTFLPLKGAFRVEAKIVGYEWRVPRWLYVMWHERIPETRPVIPNGLGKYVIVLRDGYVIHSPPSTESPLVGAKPGSYMVPEEALAAIWDRIEKGKTQVYIY